MKNIKRITCLTAAAFLLAISAQVFAQQQLASSLSDLLDLVENDRIAESAEYRQRLQEFEQNANRQQQILTTTEDRIVEQETRQNQLNDTFEENENTLAEKRETLRDRRGDLNELLGTFQGVAGDFVSTVVDSIISAQ